MDREIVIARPVLEEAVSRLLEHQRPVSLSAGLAEGVGRTQILLSPRSLIGEERPRFELIAADQANTPIALDQSLFGRMVINAHSGAVSAWCLKKERQPKPVQSLLLVGQNMQRCPLVNPFTPPVLRSTPVDNKARERWSRFIGALDMNTLDAFANLHFAIAGVGRNGSLMASSLVHAGVRHLTLIDPDIMELHNLDAMDGVSEKDLGQPKAQALANGLARADGWRAKPVVCSITSPRGMAALRRADILISCVDDDGARLAMAMVAALCLKPLLDIGSGITRNNGQREMGGDIRLVLPGERRCLACFGGFAQTGDIDALIDNRRVERRWNELRAGSLRSLNEINVHYGLRLLEDLFAGELTRSSWLRLSWQGSVPSIETPEPPLQPGCPLCRLEGTGDASFKKLPRLTKNVRQYLS